MESPFRQPSENEEDFNAMISDQAQIALDAAEAAEAADENDLRKEALGY